MASQFSLSPEKKRRIAESRRRSAEADEDYDPKAKQAPKRTVEVKPKGTISKADEGVRGAIRGGVIDVGSQFGLSPSRARYFGDIATDVADIVPGVGETIGTAATGEAIQKGDWRTAALEGGGLVLGTVPLVGDIGSKLLRKEGREALAQVARPVQEKSGVFDYSARYPPRDLGVERFRPKKVPERTTELLARPEVSEQMMAGIERGRPVADWYETGPLRKSFEEQLGPEAGVQKFDQFIDAVAATSPRSDVGTNVRNASYYYGKAQPFPGRNSLPSIEDLPEKNPAPYGHLAQNLHRLNAAKTVFPGGVGYDPKANPKPIAFAANLKGDPSVATIDTHAFRAPTMIGGDPRFLERSFLSEKGATPRNIQAEVAAGTVPMEEALGRGAFWSSKPLPTEYAAFEDFYKQLGREAGMTPAEAQAASWVGHGPTTGLESAPKSFMDFVEERILKTAKERGMDPRDVWRLAVSGKMPLLSVGGLGLGAGMLRDREEGGRS